MKFVRLSLICLLLGLISDITFADSIIQPVVMSPLTGGVSFNTIVISSSTGYVTASSVIGRKEVLIVNTSTTENIYLTGVTGSTAKGTLFPRESATFGASSSLNIYVYSTTATPSTVEIWEIR